MRETKGGLDESNEGGASESITAANDGSEPRRWRSESSISPSDDRGLEIALGIWRADGAEGAGAFDGEETLRIFRGRNGILERAWDWTLLLIEAGCRASSDGGNRRRNDFVVAPTRTAEQLYPAALLTLTC